jgi:aldehyde:ferredoxin oxidoreductase
MLTKGFAGKILYVDLTTGKVDYEPVTEEMARTWFGGRGLGVKVLYDLVPPHADAESPDNAVVVSAGTFVGTIYPASCRVDLITRSRRGAMVTSSSGTFGVNMKSAGYDVIAITGRSSSPVYLRIKDDEVVLEDASGLWGKDTWEATDLIWEQYADYDVIAIGQAGENNVTYASAIANKHAAFGTRGFGAVLGAKNLKAIACRGTKGVQIANPAKFMGVAREVHKELRDLPHFPSWRQWGTLVQFADLEHAGGHTAEEHAQAIGFDHKTFLDEYAKHKYKFITCPQCPIGCKMTARIETGRHAGLQMAASCPEGAMNIPWSFDLKVSTADPANYGEEVWLYSLANRYGINVLVASSMIAWAVKLYDAGLITLEDTEGIEPRWGDPDSIGQLLEAIAHRRGFGDVLADHIEGAIEKVGPESAEHVTVQNGEPVNWGVRMHVDAGRGPSAARSGGGVSGPWQSLVGTGITGGQNFTMIPGRAADQFRRYLRRIGVAEDEIGEIVQEGVENYDPIRFSYHNTMYGTMIYCLGLCNRPPVGRATNSQRIHDAYVAATGLDVTWEEMIQAVRRIYTLVRLYQAKGGIPFEEVKAVPGLIPEAAALEAPARAREYFQVVGFDDDGQPTPETLKALGLESYL